MKIILNKKKLIFCFLIIVSSLSVSIFSINSNTQLGSMKGMAEEYLYLGYNIYSKGKFLFDEGKSFTFRPPGYPVFVASIFHLSGLKINKAEAFSKFVRNKEELEKGKKNIYYAQAILLAISASIIFIWALRFTDIFNAFTVALLYGCNPYIIIFVGFIRYCILHYFFIVLSGYILFLSFDSKNNRKIKFFVSGILWGITSLIRPVSLIMPLFVFIACFVKFKSRMRSTLVLSIIFVFGMALSISPYTYRNYKLTERFIIVNSQAKIAFWAPTVKEDAKSNGNYVKWDKLWFKDGMPVYRRITNEDKYYFPTFLNYNLELEDAFAEEAINNFKESPNIFFENFLNNFITYNRDISALFVKYFKYIQIYGQTGKIFRWASPGIPQDFYSSNLPNAFTIFIRILSFFSVCAVLISICKKDMKLLVPVMLYMCFCIAHSITYMDMMYYYVKIPFLYIFLAYFLNEMNLFKIHLFPNLKWNISFARVLNVLLYIFLSWFITVTLIIHTPN